MKKSHWKRFAACSFTAIMGATLLSLAGCGSDLQANGPVYEYTVIPTDETYMINTSDSEVIPDAGITIDGAIQEVALVGKFSA